MDAVERVEASFGVFDIRRELLNITAGTVSTG
jgi:hypothetical protein